MQNTRYTMGKVNSLGLSWKKITRDVIAWPKSCKSDDDSLRMQ